MFFYYSYVNFLSFFDWFVSILMSAILGEKGLRQGEEEVGADGYLGKPFNPEAVRAGVAALLALRRGDCSEH